MPITVELIKAGRVALQTYSDPLEIAHMNAIRDKMDREIMEAANDKVHVVADFRQVHRLPTTMLSRGAFMMNNAHPNTGIVVAIIEGTLIYRMAQAFASLTPRQTFKVVRTFEEAMQIVDDVIASEQSAE